MCNVASATAGSNAVSDRTLDFVYGPEHQRIKQMVTLSANAPSNMMGGTTWYLNDGGLSYEKEVKVNGITEYKHYLQAAGITFAMYTQRSGAGVTPTSTGAQAMHQVRYFHQDHLGSTSVITDEQGTVVERMAYDPWGKRRYINGLADTQDSIVGLTTDRGYTEHEMLDELGIIHMNGRIYDPLIGRFMSADPHIQAPSNLQSYNRYAYVMNNPLAFTDPSGYFSLRSFIRTVAAIAVVVFAPQISAYIGWTGGVSATGAAVAGGLSGTLGLSGAVASGMVGGFLSGAISTGTFKGAVTGGLTGAAFGAVGDLWPKGLANVAGHAAVGCVSSVANGGQCGSGALAGAAGSAWSNYGIKFESFTANLIMHSIAGGVGSVIGGGKFANGATTAAMGYLLNNVQHDMASGAGYGDSANKAVLLDVERMYTTENGTISRWTLSVNGEMVASGYGMEPAGNGGIGKDRVAPGVYGVTAEYSSTFGANTLTIVGPVAEGSGRQMTVVRIHAGNFPSNTEGCYLPGVTYDGLESIGLGNSRSTVDLFRNTYYGDNVTSRQIQYRNPTNRRWYVPSP